MRDVYEVNLLSERLLQRPVGNETLFDWISSDQDRGHLESIKNGRWLWTVTSDQMKKVRPQLIAADAIYARHERVYRDE
jgi:hypothetical protein